MNKRKLPTLIVLVAVALMSFPITGKSQRLYNKERDEQAQKALSLTESLRSGEVFDRQLRNLANLAKRDFETEFLVTKFQIDSFSLSLLTWSSAHELVCDTERINTDTGKIPGQQDIEAALKSLNASLEQAKAALAEFKKAVKLKDGSPEEEEKEDPALISLFSRLGDLETLKNFAEQLSTEHPSLLNTKTLQAIEEITEIAATLKTVYDAYTAKVEEFNKLKGDLASLRILLKKVAIQSLQVDEEHWKNVASIRARRETERADVLALISNYKGIVRRLGLTDFNEAAGPQQTFFCDAVRGADVDDIRPHQMITEHMHDLVRRSLSIEEDNQAIEREARIALSRIQAATSGTDRENVTRQTLEVMATAISRIDHLDIAHNYEALIRNEIRRDHARLRASPGRGNAAIDSALRAIIITSRKNSVRTRDMAGDIPQAVLTVAALIARGSTPSKLADVRMAQELHAYSIRKSAVRARAYELTLSTSAQRLALFHKGGIKPTEVAQLVFAVSNIAITPAILAR